jgi:hypothetical protein
MSPLASKLAIGILVAALALGSAGVQVSIARAADEAEAAALDSDADRRRAAARWDAAIESARAQAEATAKPARSAAADVGDLALAADADRLAEAIDALDDAAAGRDIGAIAAGCNDLEAELVVFRGAVAANAESVLAANASADGAAKTAMAAAIATMQPSDDDESISRAPFAALRSAADRVIASHQANVAAAAAAAAAAAEAASRAAEAEDVGSVAPPPNPSVPDRLWVDHPIPTIEAFGDYRPGCEVDIGYWDWWYEDPPGYVAVAPGYPYDIEVMEYEGRYLGVKSLPCLV